MTDESGLRIRTLEEPSAAQDSVTMLLSDFESLPRFIVINGTIKDICTVDYCVCCPYTWP